MPVTKTKKVPENTSSRYCDVPSASASNTASWWKTWGSLVSIVISIIGLITSWGMVMHKIGKIEQEFRDNIRYNSTNISELKNKQDILQENHHSLTVELNIQKTRLEFIEKNQPLAK